MIRRRKKKRIVPVFLNPRRRHAVYRLTDGLLLVFKPGGHDEAEHEHPHAQKLEVISGNLELRIGRRTVRLGPGTRPRTILAGSRHSTRALANTWLVVARGPGH